MKNIRKINYQKGKKGEVYGIFGNKWCRFVNYLKLVEVAVNDSEKNSRAKLLRWEVILYLVEKPTYTSNFPYEKEQLLNNILMGCNSV